MCEVLSHRGPDDRGYYSDSGVGLANARLSIIDIEGGRQPIHNEDETIHVTYNGEIYNYRELTRELEARGHSFYTKSDTEVIVHGYEEYGESFVERLNGMFAFAIWDGEPKKLLLARDRVGVKPLYYAKVGDSFYFASEIKGILQAPVKRAVSLEALNIVLNIDYIPGDLTLFDGVQKVKPGRLLTIHDGSVTESAYWSPPPRAGKVDEGALIDRLREDLKAAITSHLVADVSVGCFLSGGLDTSTIVAYASRATNTPLSTYCMGFGEETDEFDDARAVAQHFGTDHHELLVDSSMAMRLYPRMIWHQEEPKINLYPWFVSELVRKHVKVCLSGNGGDELFGGYFNRYGHALRIMKLSSSPIAPLARMGGTIIEGVAGRFAGLPGSNRARALRALGDHARAYTVLAGVLPSSILRGLCRFDGRGEVAARAHFDPHFGRDGDFVEQLMRAELATKLPEDLLAVDDAMSMAHSLEVRVPFLDNRLLDLMLPVPWRLKYAPGTWGKLILREAVKDLLPARCLRKPKWGFSVDLYAWYRGEMGELARQIIPDSEVVGRYFSRSFLSKLLRRRPNPRDTRYYQLIWQVLGFHFWHKIFIDGENLRNPTLNVESLA